MREEATLEGTLRAVQNRAEQRRDGAAHPLPMLLTALHCRSKMHPIAAARFSPPGKGRAERGG